MMLRRPRRNRKTAAVRGMVRETTLDVQNLVYPMFLVPGNGIKEEISTLPGNYRWSVDLLLDEIEDCLKLGIQNFMFFPKIDEKHKDAEGSHSYAADNFYLKAFEEVKKKYPHVTLITDAALDPYSIHGQDGIVRNGKIVNDETNEVLAKMAVAQAKAGADIIGPSDMMDGRVRAIREALDAAGFDEVSIMSYTAKYASVMYGPFRDALDSAPAADADIPKDKKTYQMDPGNKREALIEAELDFQEGADFMMVKPAVFYLDVIYAIKERYNIPVAAYNVSGEVAMIKAAAAAGSLNYEDAVNEMLLSIKRAGADIIITYLAKDFARGKN